MVTNILIWKIMESKQKKISIFDNIVVFPILVNIILSMGLGQSELIGANRIEIPNDWMMQ